MAFGGFDTQGQQPPMSEINTTPLVDVMLVLLIIFMVTAPLMTHTLPIDLPRVGGATIEDETPPVNLELDEQGALHWNGELIDQPTLDSRLTALGQQQPQPELRLRAHRDTRYERIAEIMAHSRSAGVHRLGFVTEAAPAQPPQ